MVMLLEDNRRRKSSGKKWWGFVAVSLLLFFSLPSEAEEGNATQHPPLTPQFLNLDLVAAIQEPSSESVCDHTCAFALSDDGYGKSSTSAGIAAYSYPEESSLRLGQSGPVSFRLSGSRLKMKVAF